MRHPDYQIKAVFVLYTIYFTQISNRITINIDVKTAYLLIDIATKNSLANSLIKRLEESGAFSYGIRVGLKTILLNKRGLPVKRDISQINHIDV